MSAGISRTPIRPLPPGADPKAVPCNNCPHSFAEHEFMYSLGGRDRYKCNAGKCECGAQFRIQVVSMAGNVADSPKARAEVMRRISEAARIERERGERG